MGNHLSASCPLNELYEGEDFENLYEVPLCHCWSQVCCGNFGSWFVPSFFIIHQALTLARWMKAPRLVLANLLWFTCATEKISLRKSLPWKSGTKFTFANARGWLHEADFECLNCCGCSFPSWLLGRCWQKDFFNAHEVINTRVGDMASSLLNLSVLRPFLGRSLDAVDADAFCFDETCRH